MCQGRADYLRQMWRVESKWAETTTTVAVRPMILVKLSRT